MQLSVLVILYNSSTAQSTTLQSILTAQQDANVKLSLTIWNNGPALLSEEDIASYTKQANVQGIEVKIYQYIRNMALSKIYNFIIGEEAFDYFIPFDQDSVFAPDFFVTFNKNQDVDLILPLIYNSKQVIRFPYYENQGAIATEGRVDTRTVTSINSGMAISSRLTKLFMQCGLSVFDERFAFYGVDTAFFLNLRKVYQQYPDIHCGCFGQINHSLSMDEEEDNKTSYKRGIEYLYFSILYRLHYKKKSKFSVACNVMGKIFKGQIKDRESFKKVISCLFTGRHPRS